MAHKVLVDGTGYNVEYGVTNIGGTKYNIDLGVTNIDGTSHDIKLKSVFEWGADGDTVDEAWMAKLHKFLQTADSLQDIEDAIPVGGYKRIHLSKSNYRGASSVPYLSSQTIDGTKKYLWDININTPTAGNIHLTQDGPYTEGEYADYSPYHDGTPTQMYRWRSTIRTNLHDSQGFYQNGDNDIAGSGVCEIQVIGVNQDADRTVTFQTKNCLYRKVPWVWFFTTGDEGQLPAFYYSSTTGDKQIYQKDEPTKYAVVDFTNLNYLWRKSYVRNALCDAFREYLPGNQYIVPITKGTYTGSGNITYLPEYVFFLSAWELGFPEYSGVAVADSTPTNCECTYGKMFTYQYYADDPHNKKLKKLGVSGDGDYVQWWVRTYGSGHYTYVCTNFTNFDSEYYSPISNRSPYMTAHSETGMYYLQEYHGVAPAFVIG